MKCWSRSTLGVVVGIINILIYIAVVIVLAIFLTKLDEKPPVNYMERDENAQTKTIFGIFIVLSLVMVLITALFIVGIIKRLHKLMIPWLVLSGIGFVINCTRFVFSFIGVIIAGVPFTAVFIILVVGVIGIGISVLILWPIFTLYGDIRKKNIQGPGRMLYDAKMTYE